ncbi:MAG: MFS transporter [Acidobacteriota bacterium]
MSAALLAGIFSVFVFGILIAFLGGIKLKMAPRVGADDEQFGKIVAVFQWTMVVMAIVSGIALDTFGYRAIIIGGFVLSALAIFLVGRAQSIGTVMAVCVLLGIGGQFTNVAGNTLIPSLFPNDPSTGSNLGNTFFGLGALLLPIITSSLFQRTRYGTALTVVALIAVAPVIFGLSGQFPEQPETFNAALAVGLLGHPVTWLAALTLFCYIGLEVSMAVWITTYASELGADDVSAARTLSLFYVSMMISRLIFGLQGQVTGLNLTDVGGWVLTAAALVAAVAITMMMKANQLSGARQAVALAGFVFGPVFPTTVGVTFQHFDPSQWGTLFGIIFAVGLIGASTLPVWIGKLAKGKSVGAGLNILRVTAVILAVIAFILGAV